MSATIQIAGATATLEDGVWSCDDARVAAHLARVMPFEAAQISASDPAPESTLAARCAAVFGGRLVSYDPGEDEGDLPDGAVY